MNTPITDHASVHTDTFDSPDKARNFARRLETDRAALMKALQWLDDWLGHKPMPECSKRITNALTAAKANFPQP